MLAPKVKNGTLFTLPRSEGGVGIIGSVNQSSLALLTLS